MNKEQHRQKHIELHKALDELIADFIDHNYEVTQGVTLGRTSIMELMTWSHSQTIDPTEKEKEE